MKKGMTCVGGLGRSDKKYTWGWYVMKPQPQGFISVIVEDMVSEPSETQPTMAEPDTLLWEAMGRCADILSSFRVVSSDENPTPALNGEWHMSSAYLREFLWKLYERRMVEGESFLIPVTAFHFGHIKHEVGNDATQFFDPRGDFKIPHMRYDFSCDSATK